LQQSFVTQVLGCKLLGDAGAGDVLHVPRGMEHSAETVGTETVTFVDASRY